MRLLSSQATPTLSVTYVHIEMLRNSGISLRNVLKDFQVEFSALGMRTGVGGIGDSPSGLQVDFTRFPPSFLVLLGLLGNSPG